MTASKSPTDAIMENHQRVVHRYKGARSSLRGVLGSRFKPAFRQLEHEVGTWSNWQSIPPQERAWLLKNGFLSPATELYDFETYSEDDYLSFRESWKTNEINVPWAEILNNKYLFHRELSTCQSTHQDLYAVLKDDRLRPVDDDVDPNVDAGEWLLGKLEEEERLVLKPVKGSTGTGIHFVESLDADGRVRVNDETMTTAETKTFARSLDDYIVTNHLEQADWLDEIYPHSLNTMRVLTMWDEDANEMFVASAILRIGTEQSRPVDNFSQGGLSAGINVETGDLGAAARLESGNLARYDEHPDTGTEIAGRKIEEWDAVRERLIEITDSIRLPEYVGWDVSVSASGDPQIIEANNSSDVDLLQVHEPLLLDDRVRTFYERHDVL